MTTLINGEPLATGARAVGAQDRGLQYGDGLFETMRIVKGRVRFWNDHYARLQLGCKRLAMHAPARDLLEREIQRLIAKAPDAVLKLLVTRGESGRGYRPASDSTPTRILSVHPVPESSLTEIAVRWCAMRMARNAQLAGVKHLNRLEQVLAQNEWRDERIAEGLMLDTEGEVVCATAANLFIVSEGVLVTPDLRFSGVRGVMRGQVLAAARSLKIDVDERSVWPDELPAASEVFVTNAVRGIRSVVALEETTWPAGPVASRLMQALELDLCA